MKEKFFKFVPNGDREPESFMCSGISFQALVAQRNILCSTLIYNMNEESLNILYLVFNGQ